MVSPRTSTPAPDGPTDRAGGSPIPDQGANRSPELLLEGISTGSKQAFTELYNLFSARVYGLANRVLRDSNQAEEVAQEIFLEIWRRASRFDRGRGSGTSWIMTITHARSVDRVRQSQAARDRDLKSTIGSFDRDVDSVADSAVLHSDAAQVRACLDELTPLQRESIVLAYFGGRTQREIGQLLGVAVPTIKTRMRDGLVRLRDCMGVLT